MTQKSISISHSYSARSKWTNIFLEVTNAILIITWLHTGISKLITHVAFYIQMAQSPFFSKYPMFFSYGAPILEIVIALLLIIRRTRLIGFIASFVLMAFFTFYVIYLMIYVPNLPCSCGGVVSWMSWPQHLAFNILLTILAGLAAFVTKRKARQRTK